MFGFLSIGIMTDLLGRGIYLYSVLFWFHMFNVLLAFANLVGVCIIDSTNFVGLNHAEVFNAFIGWLVTVNFVLLFNVLPLYIASKIREKRSYWEIPMAA